MLEDLPPEVLGLIVREVNSFQNFVRYTAQPAQVSRRPDPAKKGDLKALCEVSKQLYEITLPVLYETLIFQSHDYWLKNPDPKLKYIDLHSTKHLVHVKDVIFEAPFHDNLAERCIHFDEPMTADDDGYDSESEPYLPSITLGREINNSLFAHLKDHSLRSFRYVPISCFGEALGSQVFHHSWNLGMCVPLAVLAAPGEGYGYVNHRQRNIQSLSLITDGSCGWHMEDEPLQLQLSHLITFSWRGARYSNDLTTLREVLRANRSTLKHLVIEIMNWDKLRPAIWELSCDSGSQASTFLPTPSSRIKSREPLQSMS